MALNDRWRPARDRNRYRLHAMRHGEKEQEDLREIEKKGNERLKRAGFGRTVGGLIGAAVAAGVVIATGGLAAPLAPAIMGAGVGAGSYIGGSAGTAAMGNKNRVRGHLATTDLGVHAKRGVDYTVEDIRHGKVMEDAWRNAKIAFSLTGMAQSEIGAHAAKNAQNTNVSMTGGNATASATGPAGPGGAPTGNAIPGGAGATNATAPTWSQRFKPSQMYDDLNKGFVEKQQNPSWLTKSQDSLSGQGKGGPEGLLNKATGGKWQTAKDIYGTLSGNPDEEIDLTGMAQYSSDSARLLAMAEDEKARYNAWYRNRNSFG